VTYIKIIGFDFNYYSNSIKICMIRGEKIIKEVMYFNNKHDLVIDGKKNWSSLPTVGSTNNDFQVGM
jgi:hypothetical protein